MKQTVFIRIVCSSSDFFVFNFSRLRIRKEPDEETELETSRDENVVNVILFTFTTPNIQETLHRCLMEKA